VNALPNIASTEIKITRIVFTMPVLTPLDHNHYTVDGCFNSQCQLFGVQG